MNHAALLLKGIRHPQLALQMAERVGFETAFSAILLKVKVRLIV